MSHFNKNQHKRGGKFGGKGKRFPKKNNFSSDNRQGPFPIQKSSYRHQDQLTECEVGITEYISCLDGYPAVIKARFSDFQVNEIDKDHRIAKLTDVKVPKNFNPSADSTSYKEKVDSPIAKLPQTTWDSIKTLVTLGEGSPVELDADSLSKEERKEIHSCVKSYFGKNVVASTIVKDGKTVMEFKKWDKQSKDNRSEWPANTPEFVHFIVYKEMMDTMDACFKIAQALHIPPARVTYAGVKDKRGKTSQWCCIKKYQPAKLLSNLNRIRNLKVGNVEFKKHSLKLGDLSGNQFRIALRNVKADDELIEASLNHVKENGFINFYGLQRFGNDKQVPTYLIGIKLLQGAWKDAVNLILKVKPGDDPTLLINTAKKIYADTGDAAKAFQLCDKRQNSLEKKLLEGLSKHHGNDYVNALEFIPRGIRLMYIHSFQSLIWNKMASKRIQKFGLKPVEGDLILVDELEEEVVEVDTPECDAVVNKDEKSSTEFEVKKEEKTTTVRPLSSEELDKYSIFDVVLPLPGYDVVYPDNLKDDYKQVIEEYGLKLEMPKQKVKTYNLSGTYRKLVQTAQNLEWKILYYNDPTDNLIRSDVEELNGAQEPQTVENGHYKAIVVSFTLNPASYATMVLREILKCNTSSSSQAELNDYGTKNADTTKTDTTKTAEMESLLTNKEKYQDFMDNIFKDSDKVEIGAKRELDTNEQDETQKKKTKVED